MRKRKDHFKKRETLKVQGSKTQKHRYACLLIALSGCLTGCSSWNESFDCPVGEGMRCSSLSTVNTRMDRGEIDLSTEGPVSKSHFGSELLTTLGDA